MRAIILSAGRGDRLRPLTDGIPKPLVPVSGQPLIVHHLRRLAAAGICDIVINISYMGDVIRDALGNGAQYGVRIQYSPEAEPLEAAGGICLALHRKLLLSDAPFLSVNADVFCDVNFAELSMPSPQALCLLVLANNPPENLSGDFSLTKDGFLQLPSTQTFTYTGIGAYQPRLFADIQPERRAALLPLLQKAIASKQAHAIKHQGIWHDAGTPESLARANTTASRLITNGK